MTKYVDALINLGFTRAEANVYEDLLVSGSSPAGAISRRTKLSRGSVYNALENLRDKSLVAVSEHKKIDHYTLLEPASLETLVDENVEKANLAKQSWSKIMPALYSDYSLAYGKPVVTSFEGKSAIKNIYEDAIESTPDKKVLVFRSHLDDKVLGVDFFTEYMRRRASHGIATKIIVPFPITPETEARDKVFNKERKYWADFKSPAEIAIYGDKVSIISFQDRIIGTIIDNKAIADAMRAIFHKVWQGL